MENMNITVSFIYLIVLVIILGLLFIFKKLRLFVCIGSALLIIVLVSAFIYGVSSNASEEDILRHLSIEELETGDTLSIKGNKGKKHLYNETISEWVEYQDFTYKSHQFVFLERIGDFYIAVLSKNPDKEYSDGRFYQADFERIPEADKLVFIDMKNSSLHILRKNELVGRTIDLKTIQASDTGLAYKVFHQFSDLTYAYFFTTFYYADLTSTSHTFMPTLDAGAFDKLPHEGDNKIANNVQHFEWANDNIAIFKSKNGVEIVQTLLSHRTQNGLRVSTKITTNRHEYIADLIYVQEGYYTSKNNLIYYVDNDMSLKVIGDTKVVGVITDLENWLDSIPEN